MAAVSGPPDARRVKPVLVRDVPLEERRKAAREAARHESDLLTVLRIHRFAENPGSYVAWVAN